MKKPVLKILSATLIVAMFSGILGGCANTSGNKKSSEKEENQLFSDVEKRVVDVDFDLTSDARVNFTDFGLDLLKQNFSDGNVMVSPLSILSALTMVANGAEGMTLEEFEDVFGMSVDDMNAYIYLLGEIFENSKKCSCNNANAIWVNENKNIEFDKDFLQAMYDYYDANVNEEPFSGSTLKDINNFVEENTDGMIPEIIEDLDEDSALVLVNALAFEGKWETEYEDDNVWDEEFTNLDGSVSTVSMMHSTEEEYIMCENGYGVMKNYQGGEYKFVALLPDEGVEFEDFVMGLTGDDFIDAITNSYSTDVRTKIPKFTSEYEIELNESLKEMGIVEAFDDDLADFGGIGEMQNTISIDYVIHKTYIEVDESGTKAAAATAIVMEDACTADPGPDPICVYLDRPFVYAIVETDTMTPVFIGMTTGM